MVTKHFFPKLFSENGKWTFIKMSKKGGQIIPYISPNMQNIYLQLFCCNLMVTNIFGVLFCYDMWLE
jgi:hypothetical protein